MDPTSYGSRSNVNDVLLAKMYLDDFAYGGCPEKVTNCFIFDQLYILEHKEHMIVVASNSKSYPEK